MKKTILLICSFVIFYEAYTQPSNVGIGTTIPQAGLHIDHNDGILATGTFLSGNDMTVSGEGTKLIWYPKKAAFRAGYVWNNNWDSSNIGLYSFSGGYGTRASGYGSTAIGNSAFAVADNSTALGFATTASGAYSTALGSVTKASGPFATTAGSGTEASGIFSVAMGYANDARGRSSIAFGDSTEANGNYSSAIGKQAIAAGNYSIAGGKNAIAMGDYSTALGNHTQAKAFSSTVFGMYNDLNHSPSYNSPGINDRILEIGNGIDESNRSNALTLLRNGNLGINVLAPTEKLEVMGNIKTTGLLTTSVIASTGSFSGTLSSGSFVASSGSFSGSLSSGSFGATTGSFTTSLSAVTLTGTNATFTGTVSAGAVNAAGATFTGNTLFPGSGVWRSNGAVGIGTINPNAALEVTDNNTGKGFLVTGTYDALGSIPSLGAGSRLMYFPYRAAFRAGDVTGTQWNDASVGLFSVAMGSNTTASGSYSVALGRGNFATGVNTTALGQNTTAGGTNSSSLGIGTDARGYAATVVGMYNEPILGSNQTAAISTTPLFIVGNGTDAGNRSNALVVRKNGTLEVTGNVEVSGKLKLVTYSIPFTVPANGAANFAWTHNFGYQPVILISLDQSGGGYADFVSFSYGHVGINQTTIYLTNRNTGNTATGTVRWLVVN